MYRVLRPLSRKLEQFIPVGTLTDLAWLNDASKPSWYKLGRYRVSVRHLWRSSPAGSCEPANWPLWASTPLTTF